MITVKPLEKPQKGFERFSRTEGRPEPGNTNYISALQWSRKKKTRTSSNGLEQRVSTSAALTSGADNSLLWMCGWQRPWPTSARCQQHHPMCDNQKCLQSRPRFTGMGRTEEELGANQVWLSPTGPEAEDWRAGLQWQEPTSQSWTEGGRLRRRYTPSRQPAPLSTCPELIPWPHKNHPKWLGASYFRGWNVMTFW